MIIVIPVSFEKDTYQINKAYVEYVAGAGYLPWLVTPQVKAEMSVKGNVGLLLPGGKDIDPIFYGDNNWSSFATDPEKDAFERKLFYTFLKAGKPIFGICRGFQLIVREYIVKHPDIQEYLLYQQHIDGHAATSELHSARTNPSHYVKARMNLLYGKTKTKIDYIPVNSMHHQYLHVYIEDVKLEKKSTITPDLQLTAWTPRGLDQDEKSVVAEGVIINNWGKSKVAGVQWHPEELKDYALLKNHFSEV